MKTKLAIMGICALLMGASAHNPGVYTVTIKVDTTYVKTGATEDGVPLFRQKIDTTETWVLQEPWDSLDVHVWRWNGVMDSLSVMDLNLPNIGVGDTVYYK